MTVQTPLDLQAILVERLELKADDFERYFDVEECDDKLIVAVHRDSKGRYVWLERTMWTVVNNYVRELGGAWVPQARLWEIPKKETPQAKETPAQPETPKEPQKPVETEISSMLETTDEYDLKLSRQKLGPLVPILTDAYGNVIDGFHRQEVDPNWPKVKIGHITDPVQLSMARLAANVCRRRVKPEEKAKLLGNIAELTGWSPKEIAENLGMSYPWVMKYLPQDFKDEGKAHRSEILSNVKVLQRRAAVHCENCSLQTFNPQTFEGHVLCPVCFNEALKNPEKFRGKAKKSFESQDITPTVPTKEIDTGFLFECPVCHGNYLLIHIDPSQKHKFQEVVKPQ